MDMSYFEDDLIFNDSEDVVSTLESLDIEFNASMEALGFDDKSVNIVPDTDEDIAFRNAIESIARYTYENCHTVEDCDSMLHKLQMADISLADGMESIIRLYEEYEENGDKVTFKSKVTQAINELKSACEAYVKGNTFDTDTTMNLAADIIDYGYDIVERHRNAISDRMAMESFYDDYEMERMFAEEIDPMMATFESVVDLTPYKDILEFDIATEGVLQSIKNGIASVLNGIGSMCSKYFSNAKSKLESSKDDKPRTFYTKWVSFWGNLGNWCKKVAAKLRNEELDESQLNKLSEEVKEKNKTAKDAAEKQHKMEKEVLGSGSGDSKEAAQKEAESAKEERKKGFFERRAEKKAAKMTDEDRKDAEVQQKRLDKYNRTVAEIERKMRNTNDEEQKKRFRVELIREKEKLHKDIEDGGYGVIKKKEGFFKRLINNSKEAFKSKKTVERDRDDMRAYHDSNREFDSLKDELSNIKTEYSNKMRDIAKERENYNNNPNNKRNGKQMVEKKNGDKMPNFKYSRPDNREVVSPREKEIARIKTEIQELKWKIAHTPKNEKINTKEKKEEKKTNKYDPNDSYSRAKSAGMQF